MPVQRCKGLCGNEALSPVACVPTKLRYKKVKMQVMTQYLGHDAKQKSRELVLEEHEECGCRCLNVRPEHCMEPSLFNNETCSCQCDTSLYNRDQIRCETFEDRIWDPVTCTCRRTGEGLLRMGPKQELDARKAAEAAGDIFTPISGSGGHFHTGRHHHHKKQSRPGLDVEPAIVNCVGDDCEECDHPSHFTTKTGVAVMPKSTTSNTNGWTAIGVCTFLVVVFATTTIYYWQKAKKMAKDMFPDKDGDEDGDDPDSNEGSNDMEVPSPPPKPGGKKQPLIVTTKSRDGDNSDSSENENVLHLSSPALRKELLLRSSHETSSRPAGVKSPTQAAVELVKKLQCDSKKINSVTPASPSPSKMASGATPSNAMDYRHAVIPNGLVNSTSCISIRRRIDDESLNAADEDETCSDDAPPVGGLPSAGSKNNIMELLLAAAAKRDSSNKQKAAGAAIEARLNHANSRNHIGVNHGGHGHPSSSRPSVYSSASPSGIAKAASMSELEASQLESDNHHNQHYHYHHGRHHQHQQPLPGGHQLPPNLRANHNHPIPHSANHRHHQSSTTATTSSRTMTTNFQRGSSNVSVNRDSIVHHVHHRKSNATPDDLEVAAKQPLLPNHPLAATDVSHDFNCMECVHSNLVRPASRSKLPVTSTASNATSRPAVVNRHVLQHQHSFHHPHHMTLDGRGHRRSRQQLSQQQRPRQRYYHGSYGHLLEDEDLLQQCLATLMMDAAILRQQQQLQQEQLQLQQEQLQQQQSVIKHQRQQRQQQEQQQQRTTAVEASAVASALEAGAGTDTQSVIESIAGDAATTIVTVDRLEVSVEVDDNGPTTADTPASTFEGEENMPRPSSSTAEDSPIFC